MPAEEDMATVRRFVEEVINGGNLDLADELVAPDHVNHDPTASESIKELIGTYRSAFLDLRFEIGEMLASGDGRVAHRWIMTGTHEGEMMGVEPTGRRVEVMGVEINHVRSNLRPTNTSPYHTPSTVAFLPTSAIRTPAFAAIVSTEIKPARRRNSPVSGTAATGTAPSANRPHTSCPTAATDEVRPFLDRRNRRSGPAPQRHWR